MQFYHNPRCSKSRQALNLLREKGVEPEVIEYLKNPPSAAELKRTLKKLGFKPEELLRKGEGLYKENYKNNELKTDEWIKIMVENPVLIERPIFINGDKAALGRPPENVLDIL